MTGTRRVLSLSRAASGGEAEAADLQIPVGIFDVQLPARSFVVHHKVAEIGDVSLTTEFLMRLLYSADGMAEETVAAFFGFSANEMAYVIRDAEARAYVSRSEGRIWLTDAGGALFREGDKPQILDVVKKTEKIGFDLLSLAPCDREFQSEFERALPELGIKNPELVSNASKYIPDAFRRFFGEIASRRDRDSTEQLKRSLYSVDDVVVGDRFSATIPFVAMASIRRPGEPEPFLDKWKSGHELADRSQVVHGVAEFIDELKTIRTPEDANAFDVLVNFAPEYLKDYVNRSGFSAARYFKEIAGRAGELRSNRQTVGIIGALYQPENIERFSTAIGYTKDRPHFQDDLFVWVVPNQSAWGASRSFLELVEILASEDRPIDQDGSRSRRNPVVIDEGKPQRHLSKAVSTTYCRPNNGAIPDSLEILLIPGRVAAAVVHAPITEGRGFPIPLGVLSFDEAVVRRVHEYLASQLPPHLAQYGSTNAFALRDRLEWSRDTSAQSEPAS
jgi:hypothetical protein